MTRKSKRRSSIVEIGTGPARVRIYTIKRKDGYPRLAPKPGSQAKKMSAKMISDALGNISAPSVTSTSAGSKRISLPIAGFAANAGDPGDPG
jgi:hypothetical protein